MMTDSPVIAAWKRIEAWYEAQGAPHLLRSGTSADEIDLAEGKMGLSFPAELRESLLRHDGTLEGEWPKGELLSLERIAAERQVWMDLLTDQTFAPNADHNEGDSHLQPGWWNAAWIPLDADGAGNGAVIDMAPGELGTTGQIIDMDHEVGPSGPIFTSFSAYLQAVAEQLEAGSYSHYRNAAAGSEGICPTEDLDDYTDADDGSEDE